MEADERKVLEAFDGVGRVGTLGGALTPAELGATPALAEEMVARGWLRRGAEASAYIRTEDGRLAIAGALDVTIYSRPGCHLCDEAKAQVVSLLGRGSGSVLEVNIDEDPELRERYNVDVPVVFLGARKVAKHRLDPVQFRRQVEEARRKT